MSKEACPFAQEGCPYYDKRTVVRGETNGCFSDEHHLYWPRPAYKSKSGRKFRNQPENKEQLCRLVHDEIHQEEAPTRATPRAAILQQIGELTFELFADGELLVPPFSAPALFEQ